MRHSLRCIATKKYEHVYAVVIRINTKKKVVTFRLADDKIATGPLTDWAGALKRIPKKGDKIKNAALWHSDPPYICPAFSYR